MVVHGEEVACQGIVCDLHLHVVVDAVGRGMGGEALLASTLLGTGKLLVNWEWEEVEEEEEGQGFAYTQFRAARSLWITSLRDR